MEGGVLSPLSLFQIPMIDFYCLLLPHTFELELIFFPFSQFEISPA
jgi:hypothetical protein